MSRTQSYIIVGLAMSVALVCLVAVGLIWLRFRPVPPSTVFLTPTDTPLPNTLTSTPLPTDTPEPTATATRVVPSSSSLTDAEREYLDDLKIQYDILFGLVNHIDYLIHEVQTTPELLYNEDWQTDLLVDAVGMIATGEILREDLSPPESLYELHQDILAMSENLINAGRASEMFVDTEDSQYLETATVEILAITPIRDRVMGRLEIMGLQESLIPVQQTATPVVQANTPVPTPTKQKCRVRMGSTYILVDCDQLD